MQLEGSCHCGAVTFSLISARPYPYQRCYCSICRKTQGGGGYAINLGGDAKSLKVRGRKMINIYTVTAGLHTPTSSETRPRPTPNPEHAPARHAIAIPAAPDRPHVFHVFSVCSRG